MGDRRLPFPCTYQELGLPSRRLEQLLTTIYVFWLSLWRRVLAYAHAVWVTGFRDLSVSPQFVNNKHKDSPGDKKTCRLAPAVATTDYCVTLFLMLVWCSLA